MRKYILGITIVIIVGLFVMFVPDEDGEYIWNPFDYARITEIDYKAVVVDEPESRGKVVITERLTFDIHAFSRDNLFWELWRDLPEEYVDGVKVDYRVISVRQVFDDGREPVVFTESPKLYWDDYDFINTAGGLGPGKWYHSKGPYNERLRLYECVLFYVDGLYRETVVFEIEYEMYNAALRYGDSSELYISLFSERDVNHLTSLKGQILFPEEIMPRAGNYHANTYGTNSHGFAFTKSATKNPGYHTFYFELDEAQLKFKPYNQYIEFALVSFGEDKHIFTQNASSNLYYDDNVLDELRQEQAKYDALPATFRRIKIITLLLCLASAFLTIMLAFSVDKKINTKYVFYKPTAQIDYFRDIPSELDPNFAAALVFCKHKSKEDIQDGYSAVMLSLVHKGYIELDKITDSLGWVPDNIKIVVKHKPAQPQPAQNNDGITISETQLLEVFSHEQNQANIKPLTQTEELYFILILRHSNGLDIRLSTFQTKISTDYEYTNSFIENIKHSILYIGGSLGYLQKAAYKQPKEEVKRLALMLGVSGAIIMTVGNLISYQTRLDLAFGSFFILGLGFIASAVYRSKISNRYVLLTQLGEDEYAKWRGLYNFLNSETLMEERTVIELVIWEQYLIYATAFGISEKVIKALKVRCPETSLNSSPVLSNPYYRSRSFYHSRSFRTATRTASHTARSGSHGFGGGGGYGGGGRGGGGGGGGH